MRTLESERTTFLYFKFAFYSSINISFSVLIPSYIDPFHLYYYLTNGITDWLVDRLTHSLTDSYFTIKIVHSNDFYTYTVESVFSDENIEFDSNFY